MYTKTLQIEDYKENQDQNSKPLQEKNHTKTLQIQSNYHEINTKSMLMIKLKFIPHQC